MEVSKRYERYIKNKFKDLQHFKELKKLSDARYRTNNDEVIKQRKNEKKICECSGHYTVSNKQVHIRTQKHQNFLNSNNI